MKQKTNLKDKVVTVIGATSGIGAATAEYLLAEGARVIATGRRKDRLDALSEAHGATVLPVPLDLTDPGAVAGFEASLPEDWREIYALVVCSGHDAGGRQPFHETPVHDLASVIDTNVTGTIRVCRALIEGMRARGEGHVVTLGSVSGLRTYPGGAGYTASKFAVRALTEVLRHDYRTDPIRVTEVLPGLVRTEFATARHKGDEATATAFYDGAPGTLDPEDIADAIVYALTRPASVDVAQMVVVPTSNKI